MSLLRKTAALVAMFALSAAAHAADPNAGREKAKVCAACHGENGVSQAPDFPNLAGQYHAYLVQTLKDYKSGYRKNAIMVQQAANLSQKDIDDLAEFFSHQSRLTIKY